MARGRRQDWTPVEPPTPIWPQFVDSYLAAALWSSAAPEEADEEYLDGYSIHDFSQESIDQAVRDSNKFISENREDLEAVGTPNQHGHDFWLTRAGHGAGFWDRGYGERGRRLTKATKTFRELTPVVGEDGKIWLE